MLRATTRFLLATILVAGLGAGKAEAAANVGLEWGIGPVVAFGDYDMKFGDGFTLAWDVSDSFTVGVFTETGRFRGEKSYSDGAATPTTYTLVQAGSTNVKGIRFLHSLPMLNIVRAGLELGVMTLTGDAAPTVTTQTGAAGVVGDFGVPASLAAGGAPGPITASVVGLTGKATLVSAKTKTVATNIYAGLSLRFVNHSEVAVFGTSETNKPIATRQRIDAESSYHNLAVSVGASIWF